MGEPQEHDRSRSLRRPFRTAITWVVIGLALLVLASPISWRLWATLPGLRAMATPWSPDALQDRVVRVADQVSASVVKVTTTSETYMDNFFLQIPQEMQGHGSGVIFDPAGLVLTNNHVIADAKQIRVFLNDGRHFRGRIRGADPWTDLAVVQLEPEPGTPPAPGVSARTPFPVARMGDSAKIKVGQFVVAIGNPFQYDYSVTFGVISALNRDLPVVPEGTGVPPTPGGPQAPNPSPPPGVNVSSIPVYLQGLIQTDASINPGNSGGPLVDVDGHVIGITSAILRPIEGITPNIGFAIPINNALKVARQLLEKGRVLRLGVLSGTLDARVAADLSKMLKRSLPVQTGAYVLQLIPDTPATRMGLQPGDIIVGLNGEPVDSAEKLAGLVEKAGFGATVRVEYYRGPERFTATATL
ncbi:MAG: trypsin-like peptidase domain-containing protein [Limnochordaceae bacterium]|nr:trypsin-like peptidase domain-containing protein [Limnochordaceae bacterium]